jgi:multidrug efflux pump subunit AcrB
VIKAGTLRFRAVILTTLTTFAGLTPIMLEQSLQAQFLIPMAVSLGFGELFSTAVILVLVPCSYVILEDIHNLFMNIKIRLGYRAGSYEEIVKVGTIQ